jgi:hypothetical protein
MQVLVLSTLALLTHNEAATPVQTQQEQQQQQQQAQEAILVALSPSLQT